MTNLEKHQERKRRRKALRVVFKELEGQTDNWGKNDIRDQLIETLNDTMHVVIHETKDDYHRNDMKELLHRLSQLRDIIEYSGQRGPLIPEQRGPVGCGDFA